MIVDQDRIEGGPLPREVWERIGSGRARLLMLDYDGTLAPFRPQRMLARPPEASVRALQAIAREPGTRVAVISGRPVAELQTLLDRMPIHLVGEHGWEESAPDGALLLHPLAGATASRLSLAARAARSSGWSDLLERKRGSIVLHTRGLDREEAQLIEERCRELWTALVEIDGLRVTSIDGGLELRAVERNKGVALRDLLRSGPEGTVAVYLGDDHSDEDAFEAMPEDGVSIRVGAPDRPTAARWGLPSPGAVTDFLERWRALGLSGAGMVERA